MNNCVGGEVKTAQQDKILKIEYYKSKNEKIKCDLERDNACLNNRLIGIITIFGSITIILLSLLNKDNLISKWVSHRFLDFELYVITINTILAYIMICIGLFVYYICVSRKISRRANELNQYFEDNVIEF